MPAVTEYYHLDALGSTRVVTSQTGAVLRHYEFGPFGGQDSPCTQSPDKRLFTGQVRDRETCLDYFGARHMRSTFGRFLTIDPVLDTQAALVDPQQWNRYAYARNNPMKFVDPDGKEIAVRVGNRFVGVGLETVAPSTSNGNREFLILAGVATAAVLAPVAIQTAVDFCVVNPASCLAGATSVLEGFAGAAPRPVASTTAVIGRFPAYISMADEIGANRFNVPTRVWSAMSDAERWAANAKFLDRAVRRGDVFLLASKPNAASPGSHFWRELEYLRINYGLVPDSSGRQLIRVE